LKFDLSRVLIWTIKILTWLNLIYDFLDQEKKKLPFHQIGCRDSCEKRRQKWGCGNLYPFLNHTLTTTKTENCGLYALCYLYHIIMDRHLSSQKPVEERHSISENYRLYSQLSRSRCWIWFELQMPQSSIMGQEKTSLVTLKDTQIGLFNHSHRNILGLKIYPFYYYECCVKVSFSFTKSRYDLSPFHVARSMHKSERKEGNRHHHLWHHT
jgi:hypothetical protein